MESAKEESSEGFISPGKMNAWMISTIVLGVIVLIFAGVMFSGKLTGNVVSESNVGDTIVAFAKSQGADLTVTSVEKEGSMYKVNYTTSQGASFIYASLDGKYLIDPSGLIPLTATGNTASTSNTASQTPVEVPKSDKPVVELFVMSHCPYGTQAEKGILPVANLLGSKIDFKVRWVSYAMHGIDEVNENINQYCIEKLVPAKYNDYMKCYLGSSGSAADATKCRTQVGINEAAQKSCFDATDKQYNITALFNDKSTWLSGRYPQFNIDKADNEKYGVQGSPTLIINGAEASTGRDSVSLLNAICGAFNNAPSECNTKLDATTPGPGFGWDTAGSNNLATCG